MLRSALKARKLFPAPTALRTATSPVTWAGVTPDSTKTLQHVLEDNHDKWHVYFNDEGFHNHASHHVLATWALGADDKVIQAAYESNEQRPAFKSPGRITKENFNAHLGDDNFYNAYMEFFKGTLDQKDISTVLEDHFFALEANFTGAVARDNDPLMLNRLLDSLFHPLIHVGYGLEFSLPGMLIEGLAQASIHNARWPALIPPSKFFPSEGLASGKSEHIFDLLAEIEEDARFARIESLGPEDHTVLYTSYVDHQEAVREYADRWTVDASDATIVKKKLEELAWLVTLIYGIGGWNKNHGFTADFFYMHLVTSSIFLSPYIEYLSSASQKKLLEAYCTFTLMWWIARGRPPLDIAGFFANEVSVSQHFQEVAPSNDALLPTDSPSALEPNTWFPIIRNTLVHPDNHLAKLQRALAHYSSLYGTRVAGEQDFISTKLRGVEKLDGSLFIRVASLTNERMGRVTLGENANDWDRGGFYYRA